jgi:tRNA pseudouridine13 synthase
METEQIRYHPSMNLPYLTSDFPGIGGAIKQRDEDFFVQELPLYEPSGEGEHVYIEIQKVGMTTFQAVDRIAAALNIQRMEIGYAGMKDAHAVSRQILSIHGTTEAATMGLHIPGITVQWAIRHGNKLRLGHLAGNRFAIKIRDVNPTDVVKLDPVLARLKQHGMPNYFGEQRFGRRGDNALLGAAVVRGDNIELLKQLLGRPMDSDDPQQQGARAAVDKRDNETIMRLWPRHSGMERRVLARLIKSGRPAAAVRGIDDRLKKLWVSALQSEIFNQTVAARIASLDQLQDGDLAMKEENGAVFHVENAAAEQPRCAAGEISPTGPLLGYRMTMPTGEPLKIESEIFAAHNLSPNDFRASGRLRVKGARRTLRVLPKDIDLAAGVDEIGSHITVAFTLPAGSFATALLRELMKNDADAEEADVQELEAEAPQDESESAPDEGVEQERSTQLLP